MDWISCRLVLFDLDGVLIDSRGNMEAAWAHVCREFAISIPFENYFAEIGLPFAQIMDNIGADGDKKALAAAYSTGSLANFDLISVYSGIGALLSSLHEAGLKTGIVTSKDADRTRAAIERIGFSFDALQPPAPGLAGKPAPDQLLAAAAELGIPPGEAVYIGDMAVDCEAAVNAEMAYIHAGWGYGAAPDGAIVAETPKDLERRLGRGD